MSNLKFNVLIATYNRPELLRRAIQSVLNQTYPNYEIAVVNDAGEDVENVCNNWSSDRDIEHIHYFKHDTNKGLGASRNTGIKNLDGDVLVCLDDDDWYHPWHLEFLNRYFNEYQDAKIIYTDCIRNITQKDQKGVYHTVARDIPYSMDYDTDVILFQNITPVTGVAFYRSLIDEVGLFDESLKRYEDWDMWIKISRKYPMYHIPIPTVEYTWRNDLDGNSMSSTQDNLFTNQLPIIYNRYWKTARNAKWVCGTMNDILKYRGLGPMFKID